MGFQISVAATRSDWVTLFQKTEADKTLCLYPMVATSLKAPIAQSLESISNFGVAKYGISVQEDGFLVADSSKRATPRKIDRNDGTTVYVFDQLVNPDTFILRPGGLWDKDYFVIGEMSSLYGSSSSTQVANKLLYQVKRHFHRGNSLWIGPECYSVHYEHLVFTRDYRVPASNITHQSLRI